MAKLELLSLFLTERLTSAAQEIYKMVEETVAEYQAEITHVKRENERLQRQMNVNNILKVNVKPALKQQQQQQQQHCKQEGSPCRGHKDQKPAQTEESQKPRSSQEDEQKPRTSQEEEQPQESIPTPCRQTSDQCQRPPQLRPSTQPQSSTLPQPKALLLPQPSRPFQTVQNQAIVLSHQILPLTILKKSYVCKDCGKTFRYMSRLKQHTRMAHTQEKPYCCTLCGKCFLTSSKLKTHQLIHTGERPYLCNVCGHCFNQRSNLKVHMQRKHKDTTSV